ncbi:GDP-mannose 4,6-dehydratase [Pelagibacteraceae bacterium]|nr:GDP-mannose 4,6-dehydratase [Pelagibacteraceae bacterium]
MRKFKKCLITGVSGSGGSYLAEYILNNDKNIVVYGTYRKKGNINKIIKSKRIKFVRTNLDKINSIKKILNRIKPDLIFHLASNADVRLSFDQPYKIIKENSLITLNLLEAIRLISIKPLIIIISSSEVYGNVSKKDIPIKEIQNIAPANPYSASKSFQDIVSQVYYKCFKLKIIITRMFSYTNARRTNLFQSAFAKQIKDFKKKKIKFVEHGNLNSVRTFMDINDAMRAYWLTAKKGKIGEIYNIGGNQVITVKNYLKKLIQLSNIKVKTKINKNLVRPVDVTLQIPNVRKFMNHTGWKPEVNLKDSIKKLLNEV